MKMGFGEERLRVRLRSLSAEWKHQIDLLKAELKAGSDFNPNLIGGKISGLTVARRDLLLVLRDPCPAMPKGVLRG